jgi:23S rRNA (adenine2030-N6)-methyltransferase
VNYRHAFHAGNHADVLKHAVLLYCLDVLKRKPAPFAIVDTHAGAGRYDLTGGAAQRSPEWRDGVARIWEWTDAPPLIQRYLASIRSFNQNGTFRIYPGSPVLAAANLRSDDVLMACELHPEDCATLRRALPRASNIHVHQRDGWEALDALLPPPQRRGLVLIDPSYEAPDELARAARAFGVALRRFSHGVYLWWRPLKSESALDAADAEARAQGARATLRVDLWIDTPHPGGKLNGSSLFLINPPFGLDAGLREALPALAEKFAVGSAGWRVDAQS